MPPVALILLLAGAAALDVRTRRIPNWLTLAGLVGGLASGALEGGAGGLAAAALGGAAGLALFLPLYLLRAMGAGDAKLLAAAGTFLGLPLVLWGALCSAVAGGLLGLGVALSRRVVGRTARNVGGLLAFWAYTGGIRRVEWLTLGTPGTLKVPYGLAIAAGCAFAALAPGLSIF